jgi:nicotinamidase/pyrazinamidase
MEEKEKIRIDYFTTASFDVDCQKGFTPLCPDELPVPGGDEIVIELNKQNAFCMLRVGSKDVHPSNAVWIATEEHPQFSSLDFLDANIAWKPHCMSGTMGAELLDGLPKVRDYSFFVFKGVEPDLHPFSPIYHCLQKRLSTGVIEFLKSKNIKTVIVGGLALNYCAGDCALDLKSAGFEVIFNLAASRGIGSPEEIDAYVQKMRDAGIIIIDSCEDLINGGN